MSSVVPARECRICACPSFTSAPAIFSLTKMRVAYASSKGEREQATQDGIELRDRIRAAYPFHPALIDIMRERWAAIPEFQRTRGALRFLASCLRSFRKDSRSGSLLGPGVVPMHDSEVRLAFFQEVGQQADFQAMLEKDLIFHIYRVFDLPYQSQVVTLAAILADSGDAWEHEANRAKLQRWYWNGVFGELYGSAVESRVARFRRGTQVAANDSFRECRFWITSFWRREVRNQRIRGNALRRL